MGKTTSLISKELKKIEATKKKLISRAKKGGLWENFGQNELFKLENEFTKNGYNKWGQNDKDIAIREALSSFDQWAMNVSNEDLR